MDTVRITDLPATALKVLAGQLPRADAAACRLASPGLSTVSTTPTESPIWVVATVFQQQLQAERQSTAATAAAPAGAASTQADEDSAQADEDLGQGYVHSLTGRSLAAAAAGCKAAEVLFDVSQSYEPEVLQLMFCALLSSSSLSTLVITEYCTDNSPLGIQLLHRHPDTLMGGTFKHLAAKTFSNAGPLFPGLQSPWLPALASNIQAAATASSSLQQQQEQQQQQQQQQQQPLDLVLQLLAPISPKHQQQLLQLPCIRSLTAVATPDWLSCLFKIQSFTTMPPPNNGCAQTGDGDEKRQLSKVQHAFYNDPEPDEVPAGEPMFKQVLRRDFTPQTPSLAPVSLPLVQQMTQLRSISFELGVPSRGQTAGEVATLLHRALCSLGPQLTQLTIAGVPGLRSKYALEAPFFMPALRSLALANRVYLDPASDTDILQQRWLQEQASTNNADVAAATGVSAGTAPPVFLALTRLAQSEPFGIPALLRLLTKLPSTSRQLQHLEVPLYADDDADEEGAGPVDDPDMMGLQGDPVCRNIALLRNLSGLKHLVTTLRGKQQLDALVAAVGSQLQGLTLTVQSAAGPAYEAEFGLDAAHMIPLKPLFAGMQQLTSLKVVGGQAAVLDPVQDLPAAAQHMPHLRSLSYTGGILALPNRGFELLPGMLPAQLQGLTIVAKQPDGDGFDTACSYSMQEGALPSSLKSLQFRGFCWEWPQSTSSSSRVGGSCFGWQLMPQGLGELEMDVKLDVLQDPMCRERWVLPSSAHSAAIALQGPAAAGHDPPGHVQEEAVANCHHVWLPRLQRVTIYLVRGPADGMLHPIPSQQLIRPYLTSLMSQLSGLTSLTDLHISSDLKYRRGDGLARLECFRRLRVLSLDVGVVQWNQATGHNTVKDLVNELSARLPGASLTMRILRLPMLSFLFPAEIQKLQKQFPNCLLIAASDPSASSSTTPSKVGCSAIPTEEENVA